MKKLFTLLRYNLICITKNNIIILIVAMIVIVVGSIAFNRKVERISSEQVTIDVNGNKIINNNNDETKPSVVDELLFHFRGMEIIKYDEEYEKKIEIPYCYIGLAILFSLLVANSTTDNIQQIILVKTGNKKLWMFAKLVAILEIIAIVFAFIMLVSVVMGDGLEYHSIIGSKIFEIYAKNTYFSPYQAIWYMIIVPYISVVSIASIQFIIQEVTNRIAGMLSAIFIYIMGIFYKTPFIISNGFMVQRNKLFEMEGMVPEVILILGLGILLSSFFIMIIVVDKSDCL